ncbi:vitellogenin-1-like [Topomyia yanbarensis]|uniref:vitellogenin-1-like n=1 Tax=Topomyia yanbarensis TaxID=2498891 RepID=UPI00273C9EB2|nr:vitellogenin-1-like [Topomyia yanbarensis]XP_058831464.1 vitellogenin-1-like [Topomyia yanbarensis]XP_058831465.1 vitellogenin-1-like [Topomyia yanbarensis]XP_058831466.1 vitellogenin-1-like [Topomyia yanbarensis]XP_058831467.1 vitellogenin-1-like [Topomyia yanbarensis]XP_058831468.1 vitellogenin-1-like [Topomyia yanbarensis]XP_058831469.1 vitellogenin-1-like [Topomyia yanbarensis]XP_058831471.1 vitellogenin-1-like [Topomyia yanbarensis]XP_058831472.1 vitellogenin-1-like [Topomyia yanbar
MAKLAPALLLLLSCVCYLSAFDLSGLASKAGDAAKVAAKTTKSLVDAAPQIFSPEQLLEFGKQSIAGVPLEALTSVINKICSIAVTANATESENSVNITEMNYILMTGSENVTIPLLESDDLWSHSLFNDSYDTVILVTGWTSNINGSNRAIDTIFNAYQARGGYNFVVIDTSDYVDTLYTWSAFNTNDLGVGLSEGLQELINYVQLGSIHLIGHSLGAHIVGTAGRDFQYKTNRSIPRITGLDPANPCFNEGESLSGISRGDADFVDIIHSNAKVLGKRDPLGDVDFYPNGVVSVQPGCLNPACSHARAWELYAETVYPGNENNLLATKCNSILSLDTGACPGKPIPLGFACPRTAKGNYFLKTNEKVPFGKSLENKE